VSRPAARLKVLLVTPFFPPGIGGSTQLVVDLARSLADAGNQVEVLTYSYGDAREQPFDAGEAYRTARVGTNRFRGTSSLRMLLAIARSCWRERPDVVICGAAYPTALLAMLPCSLRSIPVLVYSHGEDLTFRASQGLARRLTSLALAKARLVIANSSYTAKAVRAVGVPAERSLILHPWINPDLCRTTALRAQELRRELGLENQRVLLTVGRLEERKGHDRVIEAMPAIAMQVPDAAYLIIGKGDTSRLRGLAEGLGVAERVHFVDYASADDLAAYYDLCDLFVLTSRRDARNDFVEGFGMVYLEAGVAGKACIAGNEGGCPDAVLDEETGLLVDPDSPAAIARAAVHLLQHPELAGAMGQRARARVLSSFTGEVQLARFQELIRSAAKQAAG
jgi:phosphatidylinositol alpha-1,6-mannosyltransferase